MTDIKIEYPKTEETKKTEIDIVMNEPKAGETTNINVEYGKKDWKPQSGTFTPESEKDS